MASGSDVARACSPREVFAAQNYPTRSSYPCRRRWSHTAPTSIARTALAEMGLRFRDGAETEHEPVSSAGFL